MLLDNRKFLDILFDSTFTYTVKELIKDPTTGRSKYTEVTYPKEGTLKGRLSKETIRPTETNGLTEVTQYLKLFTFPEITIPAGSKITVTQNGIVTNCQQSGKPAIYSSHQEIPVELWRVKA